METETGVAIFQGIIDALNSNGVKSQIRRSIYSSLVDLFDEMEFDGFEDLIGQDKILDKILSDTHGIS